MAYNIPKNLMFRVREFSKQTKTEDGSDAVPSLTARGKPSLLGSSSSALIEHKNHSQLFRKKTFMNNYYLFYVRLGSFRIVLSPIQFFISFDDT
jgi:hypothetical protein